MIRWVYQWQSFFPTIYNLSRKETFLRNPSKRLDGSRRRVVFVASATWNVGRDREVIDRFVIHRELEAFRNEIFWKGLAISAVCEWNGASPDPRRAPRGLAAESSRNPSLSRMVPATPLVRSCLREDEPELSYHPEFLPFCRSARRALWCADIGKKYVQRLYTFLFIFQIPRTHYYFIAQKLYCNWSYVYIALLI